MKENIQKLCNPASRTYDSKKERKIRKRDKRKAQQEQAVIQSTAQFIQPMKFS